MSRNTSKRTPPRRTRPSTESAVIASTGSPHPRTSKAIAREFSTSVTRIELFLLAIVTVLGIGMRQYGIGSTALHNDEALQLNGIQTRSITELISHCTHVDMHPPLSYLVQKGFYHFSESRSFLRSASALFGAIAIPLTFWALLPLLGSRMAMSAAALTAMSYALIWFSRELRDYAFFYAFAVGSFGFFARILLSELSRPPILYLSGFVLLNVLATYTHFNTYLTWPVYGCLFAAWELTRRPMQIRWRYAVAMGIAGGIVLVAVLPTFWWFESMRAVVARQNSVILRPSPDELLRLLSSFGFGWGWRAIIWGILLLLGSIWFIRNRPQAAVLIGGWLIIPIGGYIYLLGLPSKFIHALYRYEIVLALSFIALTAGGVMQIAEWTGGGKNRRAAAEAAALILLFAMMWPIFSVYYSLRSCGHLFDDIHAKLVELGPRAIVLDNYYEMQYLHHYLPPEIHIARPPIWNDPNEFAQMKAAELIRVMAQEDPLLAFYDSGARHMSPPGTWNWLDTHFDHKEVYANQEAKYLFEHGLNLFPILFQGKEMQTLQLYYNDRARLGEWFARQGRTSGIAYGPEWLHMTILGTDGAWHHYRATDSQGSVQVCNASAKTITGAVTVAVSGCAQNQMVRLRVGGEMVWERGLKNGPASGLDPQSKQIFRQYIPFAQLLRRQGGMLNISAPVLIDMVKLDSGPLAIPPGVTTIDLQSMTAEGFVLERASFAEIQ